VDPRELLDQLHPLLPKLRTVEMPEHKLAHKRLKLRKQENQEERRRHPRKAARREERRELARDQPRNETDSSLCLKLLFFILLKKT